MYQGILGELFKELLPILLKGVGVFLIAALCVALCVWLVLLVKEKFGKLLAILLSLVLFAGASVAVYYFLTKVVRKVFIAG